MRCATLVENAMLQGNISMVQAENLLRDVLQLQALSKPWQWPNSLPPPLPVCFETFTLNSVEERGGGWEEAIFGRSSISCISLIAQFNEHYKLLLLHFYIAKCGTLYGGQFWQDMAITWLHLLKLILSPITPSEEDVPHCDYTC